MTDTPGAEERPRCTGCRRALPHTQLHRIACRRCEDRASADLAEMPRLYAELADAAERRTGAGEKVAVTKTPPLPGNLDVLTLRGPGGIATILGDWLDDWHAQLGWSPPPWRGDLDHRLGQAVAGLRNNLPWAVEHHPAVGDFMTEVRKLRAQADAIVNPAARHGTVACTNPVPEPGTGAEAPCGARIRIDLSASRLTCHRCGREYPREDWPLLGSQSPAAATGATMHAPDPGSPFLDRDGRPIDAATADAYLRDPAYRWVAQDVITSTVLPDARSVVGTVWLATDYNMLFGGPRALFETRVQGRGSADKSRRWSTLEEARQGHHTLVLVIASGIPGAVVESIPAEPSDGAQ